MQPLKWREIFAVSEITSNPCLDCSAEKCHKRNEIEGNKCPLEPTQKQFGLIADSKYSVRNVDTMKEASNIIEKILKFKYY